MLAQFSVILICHTLTIKIHSSNMILEKVNQTNSENIIRKLRKYKCKVNISRSNISTDKCKGCKSTI